jgi:hypothetical protein
MGSTYPLTGNLMREDSSSGALTDGAAVRTAGFWKSLPKPLKHFVPRMPVLPKIRISIGVSCRIEFSVGRYLRLICWALVCEKNIGNRKNVLNWSQEHVH